MPCRRAPGDAATLKSVAQENPEELGIDPEELARRLAGEPDLQVIDVREPYEREAGHIAGTRHIQLTVLAEQADTIDREKPVVFYCRVGARSDMAAQALRASGFRAYSMRGGLVRWASEDRPLAPEGGRVAEH
jgi:rhodanese-related sulfurtransferase